VVDWKAHERANLEEAMARGVAVVAYDCHALRVLADCRVEGSYGLLSINRKVETIELQNEDEMRVNLPATGGILAANLRTELQRGSAIDLRTCFAVRATRVTRTGA
jgi:hypothetical protein